MELQHQELIKKLIKERAVDEFPLLIKRKYQNVDLVSLDSILAIIGPRRAGKTYFLYQLVEELVTKNICKKADIFFLNFEHPQLTNLT
ncbi:AAA family ATPase [bacterium]|nr:AAA family ATPase [bacterium]